MRQVDAMMLHIDLVRAELRYTAAGRAEEETGDRTKNSTAPRPRTGTAIRNDIYIAIESS